MGSTALKKRVVEKRVSEQKNEVQNISQNENSGKRRELVDTFSSLKGYLKRLEEENRRLSGDLDKKREARKKREEERDIIRKIAARRLNEIDSQISGTNQQIDEQKELLVRMHNFYQENELQLKEITARLNRMESSMKAESMPLGSIREELIGMLCDLEKIRTRRETLLKEGHFSDLS